MPTPRKSNETKDEFIKRCMKEIYDEFPDNSQRYAVCVSYSDKTNNKMNEDIFVLIPKKAENRGQYLKRCSKHAKVKEQYENMKERMGYCLTSFNEYYKYWTKIADDFAEVPANTNLGACITKKKAQGLDYKNAYAQCASKVVVPTGTIVLAEDNLLVEPVEFGDVSIDFDDTLSTERGQELAKNLIDEGNTLHIITRRNKEQSGEVYSIAEGLGIPKENIHFTNGKLKWETIKMLGIKKHIDNNSNEIEAIKENLPEVEALKFGLEDACWEGYEAIGTKVVDGRIVPNCVPIQKN